MVFGNYIMAAYSFLDLEARHDGGTNDCDNSNAIQTQGSLVDFVNDEIDDGDNQDEDDMTNVYLTSLLPISQQPEGFGFKAPKYNVKGYKLRKTDIWDLPQSSASPYKQAPESATVYPQAPSMLYSAVSQPLLHFPFPAVTSPLMPIALLSTNRMRLKRKPDKPA